MNTPSSTPLRFLGTPEFTDDGDCGRTFPMQHLSGLDAAELSGDLRADIRSVPSMIYYGVPTVEAVLMRSLGVPRSVSVSLGRRFQQAAPGAAPAPRLQQARAWLAASPDRLWQDVSRESNSPMDGQRMRQV